MMCRKARRQGNVLNKVVGSRPRIESIEYFYVGMGRASRKEREKEDEVRSFGFCSHFAPVSLSISTQNPLLFALYLLLTLSLRTLSECQPKCTLPLFPCFHRLVQPDLPRIQQQGQLPGRNEMCSSSRLRPARRNHDWIRYGWFLHHF